MKNIIRQNFDRASLTYGECDQVQQTSALNLVRKMLETYPNFNPNKILDVGCGTGNLIKELYNIFPNSSYHINDISDSMMAVTIKRFENVIKFNEVPGCIEKIDLKCDYDLIASNMCLQWVDDLNDVIDCLLNRTKIFMFSCLLKDSFNQWYELLKRHDINFISRIYPSQKEMHDSICELSKKVLHESTDVYSISFNSAIETAKYLKNLGANSPESSNYDPVKVSNFFKKYNQICTLNYDVGFYIIKGRL